jgi:uncharacterized membrane protein
MTEYFVLKFLHVIGATVLLGTGAGIAFFMLLAHRSGDVAVIAGVTRIVVVQPVTGMLLASAVGYELTEGWILASIALYLFTGAFWLPVVWMQSRMRNLARAAAESGSPLPAEYHKLFRWWFAFGFPAFAAVLLIFWLMITRPEIAF